MPGTSPSHVDIELAGPREAGATLGLLALVWDAALLLWYWLAFRIPGWPCAVFLPLLHLGIGAWMTHRALTMLVNRARVRLDASRLRCEHRPIPPRNRLDIATERVADFTPRAEDQNLGPIGPLTREHERWDVSVRLKDGEVFPLSLHLPNRDEAQRLVRQLQDALVHIRAPHTYRGGT